MNTADLPDIAHSRLRLEEIVVGERVRKDMGDIESLSASIREHGLLQPIGVLKDRTLVWGHRRLEAVRKLGWTEIPVKVYDLDNPLAAERDENEQRKALSTTEAVALGRLIEEQEKPKARQRSLEGAARGGSRAGSVDSTEAGSVRDIAARAVGMGGSKYSYAKAIIAAAESDPAKFGDLPTKMDETGNVYGTHRELERRRAGDFSGSGKRGFRKDKSAPFELKSKRHRELAEAAKDRMVRSLSIVTGHCRGLDELDVPMVRAACTEEELSEWSGKAREAGRAFFKLAGKLKEGKKHEH